MRLKLHTQFVFLLLLAFAGLKVSAQDVQVNAILDSSKIRIGEQVKLDLYVKYNPNIGPIKIQWPSIGDTITEKIEVISATPIDTATPDRANPNLILQHQQIVISAYDSGYFAIAPFKFIINDDTVNVKYTEALLLEVHTVPTDTSLTKTKDIKEPFTEPFNWRWYENYIYLFIVGILLGTIIFYVIYTINKKRKEQLLEPEKPKIPAHITALAALEKIKETQIWKDGKYKEYYSQIADTIRLYIEERYGVLALESTTDEILSIMRSQVIDAASSDRMKQILVLSDFVKFAKLIPVEQEHLLTLNNAFDFVNGTKREEVYEVIENTNEITPKQP